MMDWSRPVAEPGEALAQLLAAIVDSTDR